jgi:hypothetical protein
MPSRISRKKFSYVFSEHSVGCLQKRLENIIHRPILQLATSFRFLLATREFVMNVTTLFAQPSDEVNQSKVAFFPLYTDEECPRT